MNNTTAGTLSDKDLVEKVLAGDHHAFGIIIKNTQALTAQIVFKMIGNTEDRKDIAQDIYLKAFHKLGSFRFRSKLSTWVAQIAYNTCLNHLEKKKLVLPEQGDQSLERMDRRPADSDSEDILERRELARLLQAGIDQLQPVYRTLISLCHEEELSYEEIAGITGMPVGTVKSYLFRARKILKDHLTASLKT